MEGDAVRLGFLRPLYNEFGGYASVYLDTDRASEKAADAIALRWRAASEQLAEAGAAPETIEVIADAFGDPDEVSPGRAVFARAGQVVLTGALDGPPRRQVARLASL